LKPTRRSYAADTVLRVLLVVGATDFEAALVEPGRARTLVCGIGPVEAALATARALADETADAVLQIGIAGASTLPTGTLALGSEAVYCDMTDTGIRKVRRVEADARLLAAAQRALPAARVLPIGTTARIGGGSCEVEAMEGFGVLRAAAEAGVPALEIRSISNLVSDKREDWRIDDALDALRAALPPLFEELERA
jgi:nucleoside phosphorylase